MASLEHITIESSEPVAAKVFYAEVLGIGAQVLVRASDAATSGFRGFLVGLVVAQPATVDALISSALSADATLLKPGARSLWGYGGAVQAPDGTIVTLASSSMKNTGPVSREIDEIVLQLGVADVTASRKFYTDLGFSAGKSYGRKYVEFDSGPISFTLNGRDELAKTVGVPAEGTGSHRVVLVGDVAPFTDPDGYVWERS